MAGRNSNVGQPILMEGEDKFETFLNQALNEDLELKEILEEGLKQVIKATFHLLNLQRRREQVCKCNDTVTITKENEQPDGQVIENEDRSRCWISGSGDNVQDYWFPDNLENQPSGAGKPISEGAVELDCEYSMPPEEIDLISPTRVRDCSFDEVASGLDPGNLEAASSDCTTVQSHPKPRRRIRKHHKYLCYICQSTFPHLAILEAHMAIHTREKEKEKKIKCSHPGCTSSFATLTETRSHYRVHSGEKPFACCHPGCGKAFRHSGTLRDHLRTHSGDKPFFCGVPGCGKAFRQRWSIKSHLRTHERGIHAEPLCYYFKGKQFFYMGRSNS